MALLTPAELLELIETAITAILTGAQSYQIGDRAYKRGDLETLRNWRSDLKNEITSAEGIRRTVAEL